MSIHAAWILRETVVEKEESTQNMRIELKWIETSAPTLHLYPLHESTLSRSDDMAEQVFSSIKQSLTSYSSSELNDILKVLVGFG